MIRSLLFALFLVALPAHAQVPASPKFLITEDAIGSVRLGMTEADLTALHLPLSKRSALLGDTEMVEYAIDLDDKNRVFALRAPEAKAVRALVSRAPGIATAAGARVGCTLGELRKLHPKGRVLKGLSESNYFDFSLVIRKFEGIESGLFNFGFDPDAVGMDCIMLDKCPAGLESMKSKWVQVIVDESPVS